MLITLRGLKSEDSWTRITYLIWVIQNMECQSSAISVTMPWKSRILHVRFHIHELNSWNLVLGKNLRRSLRFIISEEYEPCLLLTLRIETDSDDIGGIMNFENETSFRLVKDVYKSPVKWKWLDWISRHDNN